VPFCRLTRVHLTFFLVNRLKSDILPQAASNQKSFDAKSLAGLERQNKIPDNSCCSV
jgi:hypothetical protein